MINILVDIFRGAFGIKVSMFSSYCSQHIIHRIFAFSSCVYII